MMKSKPKETLLGTYVGSWECVRSAPENHAKLLSGRVMCSLTLSVCHVTTPLHTPTLILSVLRLVVCG